MLPPGTPLETGPLAIPAKDYKPDMHSALNLREIYLYSD